MTSSTAHRSVLRLAAAVLATAVLVLGLLPATPAAAQDPPFDRGITEACLPDTRAADPFADVPAHAIHAEAIACVQVYGIAQGRFVGGENVYDPRRTVTRQQMASFVAGAIRTLPADAYQLPDVGEGSRFDDGDTISAAHLVNVEALAEAGIVRGHPDGTFRPSATLNRGQMASFIAGAIEAVTGQTLPRAAVFSDASGAHQASIEKIAAIGITAGRAPGAYAPAEPISREQMASFLARMLDHLVERELLLPLSYHPGTAATLGLVDVGLAAHADADRVAFTLAGDDRLAGWRVQYVDEPRAHGSGHLVEVAGDAVLRVILTGMALPPDLPQSIQDQLWDGDAITLGGTGIVEVVDVGVYEGQHLLFVGTTGRQPFTVARLSGPQRISIDVDHRP
jgi:hypothetical protein